METTKQQAAAQAHPAADALVIIASDHRNGTGAYERAYFAGTGADLASGKLARWRPGQPLPTANGEGIVYLFPTRTYSEGMGASLLSDISPEDRAMLRAARKQRHGALVCAKVPLHRTSLFEKLPGYLAEGEKAAYEAAKKASADFKPRSSSDPRALCEFDPGYLTRMKELFVSCMTKPNRQDFMYLATKTFGFNLVVRLFFTLKAVNSGDLPVVRAACSLSWYQLQDTVFTVFGQTYMKFLGKMTGMIRVGNVYLGDFVFVYIQLCGFEFLNRLVLGPLGENPLVYTPAGLGLIFLNIIQGMISGGPLIPAINKMRRAGVISHSTMMHFYQLSSLTMQFGLFASFGYQKFYLFLTTATLVLSWTSYAVFSTFYGDPEFHSAESPEVIAKLDAAALAAK